MSINNWIVAIHIYQDSKEKNFEYAAENERRNRR